MKRFANFFLKKGPTSDAASDNPDTHTFINVRACREKSGVNESIETDYEPSYPEWMLEEFGKELLEQSRQQNESHRTSSNNIETHEQGVNMAVGLKKPPSRFSDDSTCKVEDYRSTSESAVYASNEKYGNVIESDEEQSVHSSSSCGYLMDEDIAVNSTSSIGYRIKSSDLKTLNLEDISKENEQRGVDQLVEKDKDIAREREHHRVGNYQDSLNENEHPGVDQLFENDKDITKSSNIPVHDKDVVIPRSNESMLVDTNETLKNKRTQSEDCTTRKVYKPFSNQSFHTLPTQDKGTFHTDESMKQENQTPQKQSEDTQTLSKLPEAKHRSPSPSKYSKDSNEYLSLKVILMPPESGDLHRQNTAPKPNNSDERGDRISRKLPSKLNRSKYANNLESGYIRTICPICPKKDMELDEDQYQLFKSISRPTLVEPKNQAGTGIFSTLKNFFGFGESDTLEGSNTSNIQIVRTSPCHSNQYAQIEKETKRFESYEKSMSKALSYQYGINNSNAKLSPSSNSSIGLNNFSPPRNVNHSSKINLTEDSPAIDHFTSKSTGTNNQTKNCAVCPPVQSYESIPIVQQNSCPICPQEHAPSLTTYTEKDKCAICPLENKENPKILPQNHCPICPLENTSPRSPPKNKCTTCPFETNISPRNECSICPRENTENSESESLSSFSYNREDQVNSETKNVEAHQHEHSKTSFYKFGNRQIKWSPNSSMTDIAMGRFPVCGNYEMRQFTPQTSDFMPQGRRYSKPTLSDRYVNSLFDPNTLRVSPRRNKGVISSLDVSERCISAPMTNVYFKNVKNSEKPRPNSHFKMPPSQPTLRRNNSDLGSFVRTESRFDTDTNTEYITVFYTEKKT